MPRVFVAQEPRQRWNEGRTSLLPSIDLTPARVFGDLVFMFPPVHDLSVITDALVSEARRQMQGFTDDDYILAVGSPVVLTICGAAAAYANNGRYKVLVWDRRLKEYFSYKVNMLGVRK